MSPVLEGILQAKIFQDAFRLSYENTAVKAALKKRFTAREASARLLDDALRRLQLQPPVATAQDQDGDLHQASGWCAWSQDLENELDEDEVYAHFPREAYRGRH